MTALGLATISALIASGVVLIFGTKGLVFLAGVVIGIPAGALVTAFVLVTKR